jgi:hypothetical protein
MPSKEAQLLELSTIKKYKNENYILLNIAKSSSLGGNILKWTKEKCIEDAKKYKTKSEWINNSNGAYCSAKKNGWLEECCAHMVTRRRKKLLSDSWTIFY